MNALLNFSSLTTWLLIFTVAAYFSVLITTLTVIIMENRQPVKTIAWILVLTSIPVGGLVFFYFFGQNIRRERLIGRKARQLLSQKRKHPGSRSAKAAIATEYQRLASLVERTNGSHTFAGNSTELFTRGEDFFSSLIRSIAEAKHHVHLQTYIIDHDSVGEAVSEALMAKAREGVEVRLLYDDVGCWHTPNDFFARMKAAGVRVSSFMPVRFPSLTHKINYRNHRKIAVIDAHTGYIGGMNIALRYTTAADGRTWLDTHLRISGSAVAGLQHHFLTDWYLATGILINDSRFYQPLHTPTASGTGAVQIVTSSPASQWPDIMYGLTQAFHNARRHIYIQTPYFMPTEPVMQALQTAAMSGIDVRIMLPEKPDGFWLRYANDAYYSDALSAGIKLYTYTAGFLHSKSIVIDDGFATIGSTNMDYRSFENNFEANAFIYDPAFATHLRDNFLATIPHCTPVSPSQWKSRSKLHKVQESLTRLLSPLF